MERYVGSLREDQDIEKRLRYKGATAVSSVIQEDIHLEAPVINQLKSDQIEINRVILPEIFKPPVTIYQPLKVEAKKPVAYSVMGRKVPIYSFGGEKKIARKGLVDSIEVEAPEVKKETNIMIFVIAGVAVLGVILLIRK